MSLGPFFTETLGLLTDFQNLILYREVSAHSLHIQRTLFFYVMVVLKSGKIQQSVFHKRVT